MQLKIQFGLYKGRKLTYPKDYPARPSLARTRDVLFNWLQNLTSLKCLDLFAGSGILGIEALSLGAQSVDFIDLNKSNTVEIKKKLSLLNVEKRCRIIHADALKWAKKAQGVYDIIFIDPPFDKEMHQAVLATLYQSVFVDHNTLLFIESPQNIDFSTSWDLVKEKKIGKVRIYLIKKHRVTDD